MHKINYNQQDIGFDPFSPDMTLCFMSCFIFQICEPLTFYPGIDRNDSCYAR